jgi:ABC-type branched-subunit amino acid transport system substrate-binding protein
VPIKPSRPAIGFGLGAAALIAACNSILGLGDLSVKDGPDASGGTAGTTSDDGGVAVCKAGSECTTNQECSDRATQAAKTEGRADAGAVPAMCMQCKCVNLLSPDCTTVTGDYTKENAILIGSLFQTKGAQALTNLARQRGATLAVQQIDDPAVGGIPAAGTSAAGRPLVMLSCNAYVDTAGDAGATADTQGLLPAAKHLVNDLHVPAIVGPNTSQDTLDVSNKVTISGGTVVITPTGVADSITGLRDDNLTWLMVPTDVQRAPLMIGKQVIPASSQPVGQIKALEEKLKADRVLTKVKLGIVYRDDALGKGTNDSLNALELNNAPLATQLNTTIKVSPYKPNVAQDTAAIVKDYSNSSTNGFAPDIIVLAGTAEVITQIMIPLEKDWVDPAPRPYYILIDSGKVPDLIKALTAGATPLVPNPDDLRTRVRGTGITPGASQAVFNLFQTAYVTAFPANQADALVSGVGPSYDATYAIAYALAATKDLPVTGRSVIQGLRQLAGGNSSFNTGQSTVLQAFQRLVNGEKITVNGTFGPLAWNDTGAVLGGTLEVWCVNATPSFTSSGLTYDLQAKAPSGAIDVAKCNWQ